MIYNPILDGFPTEYKGYDINTDFKVGIQLSELLEDTSLDERVKIAIACKLLYKGETPTEITTVIDTIEWFLSCGKSDYVYADGYVVKSSKDKAIGYTQDALLIWGTFKQIYDIDLEKSKMHFFKFKAMLEAIPDNTPLSNLISARCVDTSKMKGDMRKSYEETKHKVKVRTLVSKEEYQEILKEDEEKYGSYYAKLKALNS